MTVSLLSGYLRKRRLMEIRPYLKERILDLGCGPGSLITLLSPHHSYTGVEREPENVRKLQARYSMHRFFAANLDEGLAMPSEYRFDTVVLSAVIEHLENPGILLDQLGPALTDDGNLILTTPTPLGDCLHHLGAVFGLTNPTVVRVHVRIYRREELESLLVEHGFAMKYYKTFEFGLNQLIVGTPSRAG